MCGSVHILAEICLTQVGRYETTISNINPNGTYTVLYYPCFEVGDFQMYVLLIARGYPTKRYKTNGIFEFDQARALAKSGCKVVYAAVDVRSIRRWRKWGIEHQRIDGVDVHAINIPGGRIPRPVLQRMSGQGLLILYERIVDKHGVPDVLHAHFTGSGYTALELKKKTNIPLVVTEHSSQINQPFINPQLFEIAEEVYNCSDALIAVSPALAENISRHFGITPTYIPNMVDVDVFQHQPRKRDGRFRMVSTGNLIHTKRMDLTIEAFHKAFGSSSNAQLTIFGEGPKRKELEDQIRKLGMEQQIYLMGMCSRSEIAKELSHSDCFVLASESETFGVAYIEALASGVPVIATKCGGPEAFVTEENGIMVDVNNVNQLVEAMLYIHAHVDNYNREQISQETRQEFSLDMVARQIRKIYAEVLR